jgi:hypothetical protein
MSLPSWRDELPKRVRGLRIIVAAMATGCAFFMAIATFVSSSTSVNSDSRLVTYIALGLVVLTVIPRVIVPPIIVAAGRKKILRQLRENSSKQPATGAKSFGEVEDEAGRQTTLLLFGKTIFSAALVEGPTFFLLVAYMLERSPLALGAAAILLLILTLHFPTVGRTENWVEGQLQLLKEEYYTVSGRTCDKFHSP